ncbi:MAG: hypothetical protein Q4A30_02255 [Candidatus Saccharibacteria bacterium]|nr:hypothetical protein [Candidatus Saccharibacteria bacterium]
MNTAEWILVAILSITLLIFLIVGIILMIKLIGVSNEAKKILLTGQTIAEKTDNIVENVKDMTSVGGLVKTFVHRYTGTSKTYHKKGQNNESKKTGN